MPKRDDEEKRLPLDEADIRNAKRNLDQLDKSKQLLFRLLATTGMRLSEAFEIDGEAKERGVRYVIIGHKTPQSKRRVPLPANVLLVSARGHQGKLFNGSPRTRVETAQSVLERDWHRRPRKVIHSLRHRAQDRLRAAGCPQDIRWALLGHEDKTVAEGYGEGFPVPLLKRWVDKIGF